MKHQLRVARCQDYMLVMRAKWLRVLVVSLLLVGVAIPSAAQTDIAQLQVAHFVFGIPSVNLYVDGQVVLGQDALPTIFAPLTLTGHYVDFPAGAHTFAVVPDGETLESVVISDQEFTLEAGHRYMLTMLGYPAAGDLHFALIDETAAIEQHDIGQSAVTIWINNVYGIPAIDTFLGDITIVNNLAYGDYFVGQDPLEGQGSLITAHDDPTAVIFEYADAVGSPADLFAVFVFTGRFPGTIWEDYAVYYGAEYMGELTIVDGGTIEVGDSVPANITAMGQRVQFTLTLDTTMTLDIVESANDVSTGADATLWIYNAAGDVINENGEITMDDNDEGVYDAGWYHLELEAGTYTIQAGTFVDIGTGDFMLTVVESQ
jgi:hypothetical protein